MFLWIPVTLVITADGCNDQGDENDGVWGNPELVLLPSFLPLRRHPFAPAGGLRRPAPSFSSLLGNPEDERYSLSHAWVKNGDKAQAQ